MKQLKENEGIERSLLLAMAVIAGLTVANCYYNQPLLEMIRHDIGVSQHEANLITVVTQTGYALGLCFLIPMGDLYSRRRIIVVNMTVKVINTFTISIPFANRVVREEYLAILFTDQFCISDVSKAASKRCLMMYQ